MRSRGRVFHVVRQGAGRGPVGRRAETWQRLWIGPKGRRAGRCRAMITAASVSSMPHQSDVAFMAWFMPTLNPASVEEYLEPFGEYGLRPVAVIPAPGSGSRRFRRPWKAPADQSSCIRTGSSCCHRNRPASEWAARALGRPALNPRSKPASSTSCARCEAFAEANPIDRRIYDCRQMRKFGFVTTGKGPSGPDGGAAPAGSGRGKGCRELGHRHLQGRHGLAAGPPRRAAIRARQGARCW